MAVYAHRLSRQPLRFLRADDPGAGKTILAALLTKEVIVRGDLQRCLVVFPGGLAEPWQDELLGRFHLLFEILANDEPEAPRTGNSFLEIDPGIAWIDRVSRNEDSQFRLQAPDCGPELVICDTARKMSVKVFGWDIGVQPSATGGGS